ncbi:hypothetical protein ECANGB1_1246 [Enterospora canceri]|uniref:Uncharacterized protein n=1 Tax=Enterospora canceri TaxID=1081671 RepID=A0A1Y1S6F3_9MICR|nr:hypothetical protein ECANGB1_1246 [Enterospora canceri]
MFQEVEIIGVHSDAESETKAGILARDETGEEVVLSLRGIRIQDETGFTEYVSRHLKGREVQFEAVEEENVPNRSVVCLNGFVFSSGLNINVELIKSKIAVVKMKEAMEYADYFEDVIKED